MLMNPLVDRDAGFPFPNAKMEVYFKTLRYLGMLQENNVTRN